VTGAQTTSLGPDEIFVNAAGAITMRGRPTLDRELTAIAVRDGKLLALGSDESIRAMVVGAKTTDLAGAVVMPGLIDSHCHFLNTGIGWERVQLSGSTSIDELLVRIAERVEQTPPGEWVLCSSRWHETNLTESRLPTAKELDRVSPNHPIYLPRGGHVVVTNSLGLRLAGVAHDTRDPEGGEFVRDASGQLTGMLLERPAFIRLTRLLPQPDDEQRKRALQSAMRSFNAAGITAIREPGLFAPEWAAYKETFLQERSLRASIMWRVDLVSSSEERRAWLAALEPRIGEGDEWLDVWGIKVSVDGGVEGGYFREPYANNTDFVGYPLTTQEHLEMIVDQAGDLGWPVGVHVVGDAAMDMALSAFERSRARKPFANHRHMLEHAFLPSERDFDRTGTMGVGVTLQHALVYALGGNMRTYWGSDRAEDCSPARAWLDSGVTVGIGTDSPVTDFDPWLNVYGFVTRDTQVAGVLGPQHGISVAEALAGYTVGSAAVLRQSDMLGSLEAGKHADFICLDRDPLSAPVDQVRDMKVLRTFVGGRSVYSA
jgi:predicted amidohydrolase YtcJ